MDDEKLNASQSRKKRATIKDVALAAKVSPMTVSNVLNNNNQYVSSKTKARVEKAITRLNYRRQAAARNLRSAEQRSIGLIVVSDDPAFLEDQFSAKVAAGLANILNNADYTMTVQGVRPDALSSAMIMRSIDVAGVCAMISGTSEVRNRILAQLHSLNQPLIFFQQTIPDGFDNVSTLRLDDYAGGMVMGDHLLARGVDSILALRPKQHWFAIESRFEGMKESLSRAKNSPSMKVIEAASESLAAVQTVLESYLDSNPLPEAIVGGNDQIAMAAMLLLADRGYRIPEDVRVAGFNGFESHRYLRPQLTTVISPAYELGEQAGKLMLEHISTGSFSEKDLILPVHFAPGGTT